MHAFDNRSAAPRPGRAFGKALAIAAAILLVTTPARAGVVTLAVDPVLSSLGITLEAFDVNDPSVILKLDDVSAASGYGEPNPSNVGRPSGTIKMDWVPTISIQFLTGSSIDYVDVFPYFPFRDALGNLVAPPGGVGVGGVAGALAEFGFEQYVSFDSGATFAEAFGYANIYGLTHNFGTPSTGAVDGGDILPAAGGGSFEAFDVGLMAVGGTLDQFGVLTDSIDLSTFGPGGTPLPSPITGNIVTFNGTTLEIPIDFVFSFVSGTTNYTVTTFGSATGTIVAHVIPEPSSRAILVCGVVSFVALFAWPRKSPRGRLLTRHPHQLGHW